MQHAQSAPTPELRIVRTDSLRAHEEHDTQRSQPLIAQLREAEYFINPPIVAPIDDGDYVILDGANRCYGFSVLEYPHILVQVVSYQSGFVELDVWHHVIGGWSLEAFMEQLHALNTVELVEGQDKHAIAHMVLPDERVFALLSPVETPHERNAALRQVVSIYQRNAKLHRTATSDPHQLWALYPDAVALMMFPHYLPTDIVEATRHESFLPPGISRHIIHGRAVRVNYPMALLRDTETSLEAKNTALQLWIQAKLANRQVRYYAESTYQFDE